jgi:hypothetical protein
LFPEAARIMPNDSIHVTLDFSPCVSHKAKVRLGRELLCMKTGVERMAAYCKASLFVSPRRQLLLSMDFAP